MIQTTNDVREFIEDHDEPIFIYGAGNPGSWVGYYMKRCNIAFEGYLDKACNLSMDCEVKLKGTRVFPPREIKRYVGQRIRIIVAVFDVKEVLFDLHWFEENDLYCLVPYYMDFDEKRRIYNIDCMLGYFRSKLVVVKVPTIISNKCMGGAIYQALGLPMKSPTIKTGIYEDDFIKLCEHPEEYFERDMQPDGYTVKDGRCYPAGRVGDISVVFGHDETPEAGVKRWNTLRKWVNYNNLIFIMADGGWPISQKNQEAFLKLKGKKLLMLTKDRYCKVTPDSGSVLCIPRNRFFTHETACENFFDFLGWINGEF